jgi:ABC-2 type transport system permease protein
MCTITRHNNENHRLRQHSVLTQFLDLFLIELTNWRWAWVPMLIQGTITPLFSLIALGVFARDSGIEALVYVLTGNIVVGLLFGTMNGVQSHFTWLRFDGAMDYFATLPIARYVFILAIALAFLLLSIPLSLDKARNAGQMPG